MERRLSELDLWCWRYLENTRNYPGLHLTGRGTACDALLDCVDTLRREGPGSRRAMPLRALQAEDEARITGGQRYRSFHTLRMHWHQPSAELQQMAFVESDGIASFHLTDVALQDFCDSLRDVKNGAGDYSIGPKRDRRRQLQLGTLDQQSERLWFWPCFGHHWPPP